MNLKEDIIKLAQNAKDAMETFREITEKEKNNILKDIANGLEAKRQEIKCVNEKDLIYAREDNLSSALIDRLTLNDKTIDAMIAGIKEIIEFQDPIGNILEKIKRPNGLLIKKVSVPIGVIGIIYESRPNVTIDVAGICIKSGNAAILKGGKEAKYSNKILVDIIRDAVKKHNVDINIVQLIETEDREAVKILLKQDQLVDLIIPRGGEGLIRFVVENSLIPVLKHYKGVCHIYIDKEADKKMAINILINGKCQRPGVCNAVESLLVHKDIANKILPDIADALKKENVVLKGCDKTRKILKDIEPATEDDWYAEYLDLILSIKIVEDVCDAVKHINKYSSHHSDSIITANKKNADIFLKNVDSAVVYHNASTSFTDGGEFGKGAEMGISTDKLHARGPVGIKELTTYKYIVLGKGQVRD